MGRSERGAGGTGEMLAGLERALEGVLSADRPRLAGRVRRLRGRLAAGRPIDRDLAPLVEAVAGSQRAYEARARARPAVDFPPELPVSGHREPIAEAIRAHPVVVVCGETGSGKTTQIPKICLELGRGVAGMIGHTQPRRIAARTVSARIAEELGVAHGAEVGYKVRFRDHVGPRTYIKLMTDGILLAETQGDRSLSAYDTLVIDEAHERSLNIDFLLGYLRRLLPRRPDLKVVITSATIDPQRFSRHFDDAPIIEVPGRTYPVELRYHPLAGEEGGPSERDQEQAILDAVDEVSRHGPGDVLVFLPGEREIRDTAEALRKHHPQGAEVLPLFARLSLTEQQRVFRPSGGRRIVLATNVAETSLTVPGIRFVVDLGLARISRYSYRTKVQRLPIEPVSQASADQRAGRCGRVAPGVCIRLYSEEGYTARPRHTEPEVQRTNLAAVILQMAVLGLGEVEDFPFVDPPDPRYVRDGYRLLHELGAMDAERALTPLGRELARLPLDPRLGRMLLAARAEGCVREVLVIASVLEIQDPRERPLDHAQAADEAHARFRDPRSDFVALLRLWDAYREQARHLSGNKLRGWCREHFVSSLRMREWQDVHGQILATLRDMAVRPSEEPADYAAIHRAVLSGLLGHIGMKSEERDYTGARGTRFRIFPGSGLAAAGPKWVMAAELVETRRLYARTVARIDPAWVEGLAGHLVQRSYSEPRWERRQGRVMATERVSLYGLPVVSGRKTDFGRVDPRAAREIFIRAALVEGDYETRAPFFAHNRALLAEVETLEHKSRRRDVLVDEATLYAFYDERLPAEVHEARALERWRRRAEAQDPQRLFLTREALMRHGAEGVTAERYPDHLEVGGLSLGLRYRFEPGDPADGVTAVVPLPALNGLTEAAFERLVPGLLRDKLVALIKALPKSLRRNFVPAPDYAGALLEALSGEERPLREALSRHLLRMTGVEVPVAAWREEGLPDHLRMRFEVVDEGGEVVASGRDLGSLQARLAGAARASLRAAPGTGLERSGITEWDFGTLPGEVRVARAGLELTAYPALSDEAEGLALRLFDRPELAAASHRRGVRRLFLLSLAPQARDLGRRLTRRGLGGALYAGLPASPYPGRDGREGADGTRLAAAVLERAVDELFVDGQPPVRERAELERRREAGRARLSGVAEEIAGLVEEVLAAQHRIRARTSGRSAPARLAAYTDIRSQLDHLVYRGFLEDVPAQWLRHYPRFLAAIERRLERLEVDPSRDARPTAEIAPLWSAWRERVAGLDPEVPERAPILEFHWLLEELRVSLFAQGLKTSVSVSPKRLWRRWRELGG